MCAGLGAGGPHKSKAPGPLASALSDALPEREQLRAAQEDGVADDGRHGLHRHEALLPFGMRLAPLLGHVRAGRVHPALDRLARRDARVGDFGGGRALRDQRALHDVVRLLHGRAGERLGRRRREVAPPGPLAARGRRDVAAVLVTALRESARVLVGEDVERRVELDVLVRHFLGNMRPGYVLLVGGALVVEAVLRGDLGDRARAGLGAGDDGHVVVVVAVVVAAAARRAAAPRREAPHGARRPALGRRRRRLLGHHLGRDVHVEAALDDARAVSAGGRGAPLLAARPEEAREPAVRPRRPRLWRRLRPEPGLEALVDGRRRRVGARRLLLERSARERRPVRDLSGVVVGAVDLLAAAGALLGLRVVAARRVLGRQLGEPIRVVVAGRRRAAVGRGGRADTGTGPPRAARRVRGFGSGVRGLVQVPEHSDGGGVVVGECSDDRVAGLREAAPRKLEVRRAAAPAPAAGRRVRRWRRAALARALRPGP